MKTFTNQLCAVLIASLPVLGLAGQEGHGGAGICYQNGKCVTLAEAGFRIAEATNPTQSGYRPSAALINELDDVVKVLPRELGIQVRDIIGKPGDLVMLAATDPTRTERFLAEYRALLQQHGSTLGQATQILAFTSGPSRYQRTTYLLENKFQQLSLRSQALLLIHEYNLRVRMIDLEGTLKFDGILIDLLAELETGSFPDRKQMLLALRKMGYTLNSEIYSFEKGAQINGWLLNEVVRDVGGVLPIPGGRDEDIQMKGINLSYDRLVLMSEFAPKIMDFVSAGHFYVKTHSQSRYSLLSGFVAAIEYQIVHTQNPERDVVITNEMLQLHIAGLERSGYFNFAGLEKCGGDTDDNLLLIADGKTPGFSIAKVMNCDLGPGRFSTNSQLEKKTRLFAKHIQGISLGSNRIKCRFKKGEGLHCEEF